MLMNVTEAAKALGVSIQTLRNWDQNGYLKASRTAGGHRRYSSDDISSFIEEAKFDVGTCWETQHLVHLEELADQRGEADPRAKDCGGFTKEQIGCLLQNQDTVCDKRTVSLNENLDFFYELAASFSAPYLFETKVMPSYMHPMICHRIRKSGCIACDSESIYASMQVSLQDGWFYDYTEEERIKVQFKQLVDRIDTQCIKDVMSDARHKVECEPAKIDETVDYVMQLIDEETKTNERKIVVKPPELVMPKEKFVKRTDNLREGVQSKYRGEYCSRLIPGDQILVGVKSPNKFNGYAFCPYILMIERKSGEYGMLIGKKLLYDGGQYYGVITVKE